MTKFWRKGYPISTLNTAQEIELVKEYLTSTSTVKDLARKYGFRHPGQVSKIVRKHGHNLRQPSRLRKD
ncbi:MAG: transposase [Nitrososphaera sp.]|nr:transposase [Nitrososphaera sp.]